MAVGFLGMGGAGALGGLLGGVLGGVLGGLFGKKHEHCHHHFQQNGNCPQFPPNNGGYGCPQGGGNQYQQGYIAGQQQAEINQLRQQVGMLSQMVMGGGMPGQYGFPGQFGGGGSPFGGGGQFGFPQQFGGQPGGFGGFGGQPGLMGQGGFGQEMLLGAALGALIGGAMGNRNQSFQQFTPMMNGSFGGGASMGAFMTFRA